MSSPDLKIVCNNVKTILDVVSNGLCYDPRLSHPTQMAVASAISQMHDIFAGVEFYVLEDLKLQASAEEQAIRDEMHRVHIGNKAEQDHLAQILLKDRK